MHANVHTNQILHACTLYAHVLMKISNYSAHVSYMYDCYVFVLLCICTCAHLLNAKNVMSSLLNCT